MIAPADIGSRVNKASKSGKKALSNEGRVIVTDAEKAIAQQRMSDEQIAAALAEKPTATDIVLADSDKVANVAGFAPIVAGVSGAMFGSVPKWIGKKTGWGGLERTGIRVKDWHEGIQSKTFAEIGDRMGIRQPVGQAADAVAGVSGSVGGFVSDKTGFSAWRRRANLGSIVTNSEKTHAAIGTLDMNDLHSDLHQPVAEMKQALHDMHLAAPAAQPVTAAVTANLAHGHIPPAGTVASTVEHVLPIDRLRNSIKKIEEITAKEGFEVGGKATAKGFGSVMKQAGKVVESHEAAIHWQNPKAGIKTLPGRIGKTSAMEGLMNGSFIVGSGISMVSDAHSFSGKLKTLKQTYADMHHMKASDVSTTKILFGDVGTSIGTARWKMVKSLFASEGANAVSMAVNIRGAKAGHKWGFLKSSVAYMAPGMVAGAYTAGLETWEPLVKQMNKMRNAGVAIPAEAYAQLLRAASPELMNRKADDQFIAAVAQQYAAEKAVPAMVLQEIDDGRAMHRVHNLRDQYEAAHPANQAKGSHVARVQGQASKNEQQAVGKHTTKLKKAMNAAEIAGYAGSAISDL